MRYLAPVALFVVTATGCSAGSAFAGPVVCKVWLNAATDEKDPIGKAVVLALKEKLAKSEFFDVVDEGDAQLEMGIVSLPVGGPGVQTAMAVNVIVGEKSPSPFRWGYQLAGSLGLKTCGRDVVDTCAQGLVAGLDQRVEEHREIFCGSAPANADDGDPAVGSGSLGTASPTPAPSPH